jgi:hypothetical protein
MSTRGQRRAGNWIVQCPSLIQTPFGDKPGKVKYLDFHTGRGFAARDIDHMY